MKGNHDIINAMRQSPAEGRGGGCAGVEGHDLTLSLTPLPLLRFSGIKNNSF